MMENPFPPFDPDGVSSVAASGKNGQRLRDMPLRSVFPSLLTLLAIAAGLSAIRFSAENRIELGWWRSSLLLFLMALTAALRAS